jgi:hypothetical protein
MGKGNSSTFKLTKRKTRTKTLPQCFSVLFFTNLGLNEEAKRLRTEFLEANPNIAIKWADGAKHQGEKDPTQIIKFRALAAKAAWRNATEQQKKDAVTATGCDVTKVKRTASVTTKNTNTRRNLMSYEGDTTDPS